MNKVKIKIGDLFDIVSNIKNHEFKTNQVLHSDLGIKIKDPDDNYINVLSFVKKNDTIINVVLEDGISFKAGSKHCMYGSTGLVFVSDLKVGDEILLNGQNKKVLEITSLGEDEVFDVSIDSKNHLYKDSQGLVHHNTYGITQIMKRNGKKLIEPVEIPDGLDMDELEDAGFSAQEETDGDWVHVKGSSSAFGLYMNLYKYKNKIVVFDDCDSVFSDKDAVNLLKAALDTSEKRVLSWISKATTGSKAIAPPRFEFKGQIIFISNLYMKKIDSAVRGRSFVVDITLRAKDIILRIKSILPHIGKDVLSMKSKQMALEYLEEYADKRPELEVSIRSLMRAALIIESGNPNWRRMIEIQNKNS